MKAVVAVLVAPLLLSISCVSTTPFEKLSIEANKAGARGDHGEEISARERLRQLAPSSPYVAYDLAVAYASANRRRDAAAAFADAAAKGFCDARGAKKEPAFRGMESEPAYVEALARVRTNEIAFEKESLEESKLVDPRTVPPFRDLDTLDKVYGERFESVAAAWRHRPPVEQARDWHGVLSEWIAALRRHAAEHQGSADSELARRKVLDVFFMFHTNYPPRWWGPSGMAAAAAADDYLAAHPDSAHAAEIAFRRASARWFGREMPEPIEPGGSVFGDGSVSVTDPTLAARAESEMAEVARRYPGSAAAGKAEYFAFFLKYFASGQQPSPALRRELGELEERYRRHDEVSKFAKRFGAEEVFPAFQEWDKFDETDLSGRRWNLASLKGKVALITFWATWCGPCLEEVPVLRRLRDKHADADLVMIGVSVDDDRAVLEAFMKRNGITWPQVSRPVHSVRNTWLKYRVNSFPTNVVLDRDGNVAYMGVGSAALERAIDELAAAAPGPR